jgi:hypothetical protein
MGQSRLAIATHEAAHAQIGLALGLTVSRVEIFPSRADAAGITTFTNFDEVFTSDRVKVLLAGGIGERRVGGSNWYGGAGSDCNEVAQLMTNAAGLDLEELIIGADRLVTRYWLDIKALAAALVERQCLTGAEILKIVRWANDQAGLRSRSQWLLGE